MNIPIPGLCATVARWLRRQNRPIWYYLVHDNFFVSGLDWGTIIARVEAAGGFRSVGKVYHCPEIPEAY